MTRKEKRKITRAKCRVNELRLEGEPPLIVYSRLAEEMMFVWKWPVETCNRMLALLSAGRI